MQKKGYWEECVSEAFDDAKISATPDQIQTVAGWVAGAHENFSMAHGYDCIPNPLIEENRRISVALEKERNKTVCRECSGTGRIVCLGPYHSSDSECSYCRGEGKL